MIQLNLTFVLVRAVQLTGFLNLNNFFGGSHTVPTHPQEAKGGRVKRAGNGYIIKRRSEPCRMSPRQTHQKPGHSRTGLIYIETRRRHRSSSPSISVCVCVQTF